MTHKAATRMDHEAYSTYRSYPISSAIESIAPHQGSKRRREKQHDLDCLVVAVRMILCCLFLSVFWWIDGEKLYRVPLLSLMEK